MNVVYVMQQILLRLIQKAGKKAGRKAGKNSSSFYPNVIFSFERLRKGTEKRHRKK